MIRTPTPQRDAEQVIHNITAYNIKQCRYTHIMQWWLAQTKCAKEEACDSSTVLYAVLSLNCWLSPQDETQSNNMPCGFHVIPCTHLAGLCLRRMLAMRFKCHCLACLLWRSASTPQTCTASTYLAVLALRRILAIRFKVLRMPLTMNYTAATCHVGSMWFQIHTLLFFACAGSWQCASWSSDWCSECHAGAHHQCETELQHRSALLGSWSHFWWTCVTEWDVPLVGLSMHMLSALMVRAKS